MAAQYPADDMFGPVVDRNCRGGFDFTLLFEQTVLGILPAAIFALTALARFVYLVLRRTDTKTRASSLRHLKLVAATVLLALQVSLLALWSETPSIARTRASVPSAAVNVVVAVELLALTWVEDARSVRPSSLLNVYLVSTLFFDAVQIRTLYLRTSANSALAAVCTTVLVIKAVLLFLEARRKTVFLTPPYQGLPPEATSSIINRSFLWWVNDLFRSGLRSILTSEKLYLLDDKLASAALGVTLAEIWERRKRPERRFEFPWAACRALWRSLLLAVFPRLCMIGFTFAQPFLISRVLRLLSQPPNPQSTNDGYGLVGATALIYLGLAVSTLHYNQSLYRFVTMFRGATVAVIYNHTLVISTGAYDESAALTLMSTDVDRIILCLVDLNECWARAIEVVVGAVLLALQLGWVCIVPILVVVGSFLGAAQISRTIGGRQKIWVEAVQKRISITASLLAGMKSVKMMGLSRILTTLIQDRRVEETHRMARFRWSIVTQNMVQNLPWFVAPALTFVVYAAQAIAQGRPSIDTTQAFTSLSIITLLTIPASKLLSAIPSSAASTGCFERIQAFLLAATRTDLRITTTISSPMVSVTEPREIGLEDVELTNLPRERSNDRAAGTIAISVNHLSVRPAPSAAVILQGVNFDIPRKSLTTIVGQVASGKTTLLKAILGELSPERGGAIHVASRRIAFAAQTPWLPNTTIKKAVVGPGEADAKFDHDWYSKTLHACALDRDIALLQGGEDTLIGGAGTVLSGGQRHRVALARAVYSRAPILLLDDVLSALDLNTQVTVMSRLFGELGLLRGTDVTVVLVTHATRFLSYADKILLVANRRVEDGGTRDDIAGHKLTDALRLDNDSDLQVASETVTSAKETGTAAQAAAPASQRDDLARATGDYALYRYYFRAVGVLPSAVFVGFVIANVLCNSFGQVWLYRWSNAGGSQIALYMSVYLVVALLAVIGMGGYVWAILVLIGPSTARKFHARLLNVVMRAPLVFFSTTDIGSIMNRFSQDMTLIEGQLPTGVLVAVSNLFDCIACAALVATGSSYMAISIPVLIIAVWALQHVYLRTSRQLRLLDLEARGPLYSHFMETLTGLITIRAFGWERDLREQNYRQLDYSQRPYYLLYCIQRWLNLVLDLVVGAEAVLVVGLAIWLRSSTSVGLLGVSLNNLLTFSTSLSALVSGWTMLETSLGSIARLRDLEATVKPEDDNGRVRGPPSGWPSTSAIEFRNVTASYSPEAKAIQGVSLKIEPGQKIGVCGRTGSGKSSLISTLLQLLDIDSGTVLIDHVDLTSIPRDTLREHLLVVPQDPLILSGTLRLNLDPHATATDVALRSALLRVGLQDLLAHSRGLNAEITSSTLSAGQQQLLALARLLLKKAEMERQGRKAGILLLDEATSNVDLAAEAVLQRVVKEDFSGYTVVAVAHRLETILDSDMVVVMDAGKVVEVGPPGELLGSGGWFAGLVGPRGTESLGFVEGR